jgi:pyrrolidone-carboxylate peptidase
MSKCLLRISVVFFVIVIFFGASLFPMVGSDEIFFEGSKGFFPRSNIGFSNILITGFWNPTGLMIAPFSNDPNLNPDGWKGENWEDLGYNVYSYFPTPGTYEGDFEVDYQDTWNDFWNITEQLRPVAIISFGAGSGPWEIEYNARNLGRWIDDDERPFQPTPVPPDDSVPVDYIRHSTLPVQAIEDAVNDQTSIFAWVDWYGDPGAYLCEFIAYLGMWYQSLHNSTDDSYPCKAAGFIHVHPGIAVEDAMEAANITIRETIQYLLGENKPPSAPTINGPLYGNPGTEYEYKFKSIDPEGDDVYYWILWFEECPGVNWDGPYQSGEEITKSYTWENEGTYTIQVKAEDSHGAESEWTFLEVSMPKIKEDNNNFESYSNNNELVNKITKYILRR